MGIWTVLIIAAVVFGLCFLADKGFQKLFRSQAEHKSGKAVRLSKRYSVFGLIIALLGLAAIFTGISGDWLMLVCGCILILMGVGLVTYYMAYGIFYDTESFVFTSIGKTERKYYYKDIEKQQLYNNQGHLLIELHMADGKTVQIQSTMEGAFDFMDYAYAAWLRQTGRREEDCSFHDPANSCWFPPVEG